jgi:hypothetical protein
VGRVYIGKGKWVGMTFRQRKRSGEEGMTYYRYQAEKEKQLNYNCIRRWWWALDSTWWALDYLKNQSGKN